MLKEFILFLKNPKENSEQLSTQKKLRYFLYFLLLHLFIVGACIPIIYLLEKGPLKDIETHKGYFNNYSLWTNIMLAGIIMPFVEELIFRLNLRFKEIYINISILVIMLCLVLLTLGSGIHKGFIVGPLILSGLFILFNKKVLLSIKTIYIRYYKVVFYTFSVLFAVAHLTNLNLSMIVITYSPLLLVSQMGGGLILGFLRLKCGLFWAVASHGVFNIILLLTDEIFTVS